MDSIKIAPDIPEEELARIAISIHHALGGMPIMMKSRGNAGVLVEDGDILIAARECQALDCVFSGEGVRRITLEYGRHAGITMFAAAIESRNGLRVAAIGIIDTLGMLSLRGLVSDNVNVDKQLHDLGPWQ
ncbi:MAG TPA: DUF2111 domain-containing protein [Methanocella sp.]|nr:DUF2111 domain-containing protein [Methanocella sp.]